jgi:2-polyprenyl-6-methoxyphenol hydroxylase-like FAD-dependent oxidoreductase
MSRAPNANELLIVGAGPVGLTMATELARYGIPVRIIDRASQATQNSKALVIWSRTLELMDRMGCAREFLDHGLPCRGGAIRSGKKVLGHATFDEIDSPYNFALMIPQSETERLMGAQLARLGVTVERQVELTGFSERADCVEARLRHEDGRQETLTTPWLIGCDGAHSVIRHCAGMEFGGSSQGGDWMLADVRLDGEGSPPRDEVATYLQPEGPFVIFPQPGGRARIVAQLGQTDPTRPRSDPTLQEVQAVADARTGGGFRVSDPIWLTVFRINERKVSAYRQGRIFLAGDAAHIHSPAGGQGMNTGMQDAFNLAWKLAMVIGGSANAALLDSYSPERSAIGEIVLRNATRLTDMATLTEPLAQKARDLALRFLLGLHAVRNRFARAMTEVDLAYSTSALSVGTLGGSRMAPHEYAGSAPGSGKTPRFVLFAADQTRAEVFTARYPALLEPVSRSSPHGDILVVRPDGYVGLSAAGGDWLAVEKYLRKIGRQNPPAPD